MKLENLLEQLEKAKKSLGDDWEQTDVRVYADHAQCELLTTSVDITYSNEEGGVIYESSCSIKEYVEFYEEEPNYKFLSISAIY